MFVGWLQSGCAWKVCTRTDGVLNATRTPIASCGSTLDGFERLPWDQWPWGSRVVDQDASRAT